MWDNGPYLLTFHFHIEMLDLASAVLRIGRSLKVPFFPVEKESNQTGNKYSSDDFFSCSSSDVAERWVPLYHNNSDNKKTNCHKSEERKYLEIHTYIIHRWNIECYLMREREFLMMWKTYLLLYISYDIWAGMQQNFGATNRTAGEI